MSLSAWPPEAPAAWAPPVAGNPDVIGAANKAFPDFTSISTGTPSFIAGTVDLEAQSRATSPPQVSSGGLEIPVFNEARSTALKYFDVTTQDVQEKLMCTLMPHWMLASREGGPQLVAKFSDKPDLYGPFWVCVTAALTIFVGSHGYAWAIDSLTATSYVELYAAFVVLFTFWSLVPAAVRLCCIIKQVDASILKLDYLSCVYGYSLASIIPMSLLCMVPSKFLQFLIVGAALSFSLAFLSINLFADMSRLPRDGRFVVTLVIGLSHLLLFSSFPFFFFTS